MKKYNAIVFAFKEIYKLENKLIPTTIILGFVSGFIPFVNILFSSKIVDLLVAKSAANIIINNILIAIIVNFILFFLNKFLSDTQYMLRSLLYNRERESIANKLFKVEFKKLENSSFKELIHKHAEAQKRVYSSFDQFSWMLRDFISGSITIIISVINIFPLLKIGFTKTGSTFFESPGFLLYIIGTIIVMAIIMLLVATRMNKQWFKASDEYSHIDKIFCYFSEMFSNYKTGKEIRLYNEQEIIEKITTNRILTEGEDLLKKISKNSAKMSSFIAILGSIVGFGVYIFIAIKGHYGLFGIGELVLYCGSFMQIISGVMRVVVTFGKTEELLPLINYYFEIINTNNDMTYGEKTLDLSKEFEIEFRDVCFRYPGSEFYILENINLKICNGEHIAVVGRNGSGKTTFIKLLCRLYDVDKGAILINGINIKEYSKESLQKLYSVVFQDFRLFAISIYDNILANSEFDREKFLRCLEQADINSRVQKMSEKENTYLYKSINAQGIDISGGEEQKLALARALYKDSALFILDEPTAALDPIAENEIYEKFNSITKNKTTIYISHRLSSCIFCDRIIVFDSTNLIEEGNHEELLKKGGKYSELWNSQSKYYI